MDKLIDPSWINISNCPKDLVPVGTIAFDIADEEGDYSVVGFYDKELGQIHIQDFIKLK